MIIRHGLPSRPVLASLLALLLLAASPGGADSPDKDALGLAVGKTQEANLAALKGYSWKVSTALAVAGESKATNISEMSFDGDGKLHVESLGSTSTVEEKRGLRGHRQDKKIEEFAEYLDGVLDQSFRYVFLSKGALVDIFDRATLTEGTDSTRVEAGGLFVEGDHLALSVDSGTHILRALTFRTLYEGDEINGVVTYEQPEAGPNRPVRFELGIPAREVTIVSETLDWKQKP